MCVCEREGGREGWREGGRDGGREGGRKGGREGGGRREEGVVVSISHHVPHREVVLGMPTDLLSLL